METSANFNYLLSLFLVFLQLIFVVLVENSSYILWKTNLDDSFFVDIENSLREPLLIGFYKSNSSCGDNTLISQYWENMDGCYCMENKELTEGKCSSEDLAKFCVNIDSQNNTYKKWKGNFICKKQANYTYNNYFDFVKSLGDCPISHPKKCGILDDVGHFLCLKEDEICPINDIKVVTDYTKEKYATYEAISLGSSNIDDNSNTTLIYSNRNPQGKIVSEFKVSEEQPCYWRNIMNSPSIQNFYKLAVTTQNQCDELDQDKNFIILDTYNNRDFFSQNVIPELKESLSIDFANSNPIHLFYRNYIGMKSTFISKFDEDNLKAKMVKSIFDCLEKLYTINKKDGKLRSAHLSTLFFSLLSVYVTLYILFLVLVIFLLLSLPSDINFNRYFRIGHVVFACSLAFIITTFVVAYLILIFGFVFKSELGNTYQIFRNGFSVDYSKVMNSKLNNIDLLKIEPLVLGLYLTLNLLIMILIIVLLTSLHHKINSGDKTLINPLKSLSNLTSVCCKSSETIDHNRLPEAELTNPR